MGTGSSGPGTLLAGRYRLEDLLAESGGARFWRATDTVLARSVAVHAVPSEDPRAPGLLEAARVSATVTDPHLLRVLDCDDDDGLTWVVNEWGEGISLDLMLQQGTLPASRAAWLVREVAEAIAAGHAQGVAHGRLNPEAVLVTNAGAVKLIGYVVDASLQQPRPPDPVYGALDEREADVINLAGILYAALTGRWPGIAPSALPRAPREARRTLRPRQVRAGVPRTLDAICQRVLNKEASQHSLPIETALEIAAALADYVGDPGHTAPLDAEAMHSDPAPGPTSEATVSLHVGPTPEGPRAEDGGTEESQSEPTQIVSSAAKTTGPTESTHAGPDPEPDLEATQTFRPPSDGPDSLAPLHPPSPPPPGPPPSPFPDLPERPLFASTQRRVPRSAGTDDSPAPTPAAPWTPPVSHHGAGSHPDFWPFETSTESAAHTGQEGRGWMRTAVVVGVLLVLLVAMVIAFNVGRQGGNPPGKDRDEPSGSTGPTAAVKIAGVRDFDPLAQPPRENPESAPNAVDGDDATSWTTSTYRGDPALGGLKAGVGLVLDLGSDVRARSVTVQLVGEPTSFEVYAAPSGVQDYPDALDQLDKVGAKSDAATKATVDLEPAPKTRYLVVWLTKLPPVTGGYRGEITNISVRS